MISLYSARAGKSLAPLLTAGLSVGECRGTAGEWSMHVGFGDCELDTERHTLRRRGQSVSLEPKALQVLVYLIQRHGHAVTTHELCQEFYPGPSDEYKEYALRNCLYK